MQLDPSTELLPPNTTKSVVSNVIYFNTKAGATQKPLEAAGDLQSYQAFPRQRLNGSGTSSSVTAHMEV